MKQVEFIQQKKAPTRVSTRSERYLQQRKVATPGWANSRMTSAVYKERDKLRSSGLDVQVDHIVPLRHPLVCGLHWHHNLQILDALGNLYKANHVWPDKAGEHLELFPETVLPEFDLHPPRGRA